MTKYKFAKIITVILFASNKMKSKFKKIFILCFIVLSIFSIKLFAAEYNGRNIDGYEFDCTAYSYSTGKYYYVTVEFSYNEALISFSNGGYIILTMDDEVIDDPSAISCYDYRNSVYWELDVQGL